jgi:hypothetical protein
VHDRELKGLVAAMKPEAKAKFSEVLDIHDCEEQGALEDSKVFSRALCACNAPLAFGRQRYSQDCWGLSWNVQDINNSWAKVKIRWLGLYPDSNTRSNKCKVVEFTQNTKMVASIHIYSNTKMVASIRDADELKMFAWDNEDA